jgi:predicted nucleic acid-binding protein
MSIIVDSPIWSLAFRRKLAVAPEVVVLADLVKFDEVHIIGAVRQEVLSGIRDQVYFERVREQLSPFPDLPLSTAHYERAAEFSNLCRVRGIQGSNTDFLICAVSDLDQMEVFTNDRDFEHFAKILPIRLLPGRTG